MLATKSFERINWFFTSNVHQHKLTLSVYCSHPNAILSEAIEDLVTCMQCRLWHARMQARTHARTHTRTHTCAHTRTHTHTWTCTHYIHAHICMCAFECLNFHLIVIRYFSCQVLQYTRYMNALCHIHQQMCEVARLVCFSCIWSVFLGAQYRIHNCGYCCVCVHCVCLFLIIVFWYSLSFAFDVFLFVSWLQHMKR